MSEPLLEITGLTAGYDGAAVVRGVDLRVGPGEIVALLGANGAGKTTTLRVISGVVHAMAGSVRVLGADIARRSPTGSRAAVCRTWPRAAACSSASRWPSTSGWDTAASGSTPTPPTRTSRHSASCANAAQSAVRRRTADAGVVSRPRTKAAVAAARRARLGLAPVIVERLLPVVRQYATEAGAGVVLVEQHVELALEVADRAVAMSHGEVVLDRPAAGLRGDRQLLAASYLGDAAGEER